MLPAQNRLAKVRDFNLLMNHGTWINGDLCTLKVLTLDKIKTYFPKKEDPETFAKQLKIAFTVGLKISKSAVVRNRIKRQLREVVRILLLGKKLPTGYYLLFVARPGIVDKNYTEISQEVALLLKKARLL